MKKLLPFLLSGLLLACSDTQEAGNQEAGNHQPANQAGHQQPSNEEATAQAPNEQAAVPVEEELVREKAEAFLKEKLGEPAGYEFVSLSPIDTVTFIDNINYRKNQQKDKPHIVAKIDSIAAGLGERVNDPAAYTYLIRFRTNNGQGAEVHNERLLQVGPAPDYEVLNMAADREKLSLNPNDFPGYREMIVKNPK
jgi:hypothetical protein